MRAYTSREKFKVALFLLVCMPCQLICKLAADEKSFEKEAVRTHNVFRAIHSSPALKLDIALIKRAKQLVKEAARLHGFRNLTAGENLYEATSTHYADVSGREVTEAWYQDVCLSKFDFEQPEKTLASSFTQIVWKGTLRFGIAKATSEKQGLPQVFVAAVYKVPGNVKGQYRKNVSKGRFKKSYCDKVPTRGHIGADSKVLTTVALKERLQQRRKSRAQDEDVAKKSFLQQEKAPVGYTAQVSEGDISAQEKELPENDYDLENFKANDYQNSLESEESSHYETFGNPLDVLGPKERYYTMQHGNKKFDTIITQAQANQKADLKNDPALGSEYVSFPQDNIRSNDLERYWDYVPITNKLQEQSPEQGSRQNSRIQQFMDMEGFGDRKLNSNVGAGLPFGQARENAHAPSPFGLKAKLKLNSSLPRIESAQAEENTDILSFLTPVSGQKGSIEPGSKRQSASVVVRNRSPESNELQSLREAGLLYINSFRKIHDSPELKLDSHMSAEAEDWANILASRGKVERNGNTGEAENVFYQCGKDDNPVRDAVVSWYKDICEKGYNFESGVENTDSDQFTNMIWKGSSKLGLGVAKKDISIDNNLNLSCYFVVARYDENPLNHLNAHKKNVLKGRFNETLCKSLAETADTGLNEERRLEAVRKSEKTENLAASKLFEKEILSAHNNFRKVHNAGKLKLNLDMCKESTAWAEKIADSGSLKHDPDTKDGENLYMACVPKGRKLRPWKSVVAWYREVCDTKYNFETESGAQKAGHFTQIVWKDSKSLGVGVAIREKKPKLSCAYVVTRYRNAGNILGLFTEKVLKGSFDRGMCDRVINMAESAVKEVDASFEHVDDQVIDVAKTEIGQSSREAAPEADVKKSNDSSQSSKIVDKAGPKSSEKKKAPGSVQTGRWEGMGSNDTMLSGFFNKQEGVKTENTKGFKGTPLTQELLKVLKRRLIKSLYKSHEMINQLANQKEAILKKRFVSESLSAVNKLRQLHNSSALVMDKDLCRKADEWAYVLSRRGSLDHDQETQYGESLYYFCPAEGGAFSGREAISTWYKEGCERFYDYNKEDGSQGADDFTQIIWKGTKRFCIGFANVDNGDKTCKYIVARYKPTGNVVGAFRDNVQTTVDKKTCIDPNVVYEEPKAKEKVEEATKKPDDFTKLEEKALSINNVFREIHGSPKLQLNHTLCRDALEWARNLAATDELKYDMATAEGENIYSTCKDDDTDVPVQKAFVHWYQEVCDKDYDFSTDRGAQGASQFTQMVWKGSNDFGIGVAKAKSKEGKHCTYIVGRYSKPGNVAKQYKENVLKGTFEKSMCPGVKQTANSAASEFERSYIGRIREHGL